MPKTYTFKSDPLVFAPAIIRLAKDAWDERPAWALGILAAWEDAPVWAVAEVLRGHGKVTEGGWEVEYDPSAGRGDGPAVPLTVADREELQKRKEGSHTQDD